MSGSQPSASASPEANPEQPTRAPRSQLLVLIGLAALFTGWFYYRWQEQQDPDAFQALLREQQAHVRVQVEGEVAKAGLHELPGGSLVTDALTAAGCRIPLTELPGTWLNLPAFDGMKLQVWKNEGGSVQLSVNRMDAATMGLLLIPLDINSATAQELASLPEIGPKTAEAIVNFRTANGPFRTVDDLNAVKGVGEKTVEALRFQVVVSPPGSAFALPPGVPSDRSDGGTGP